MNTMFKRFFLTFSFLFLLALILFGSTPYLVRAAAPTPIPPTPSGEFAEALKDNKLTIAFIPQCATLNIFTTARKGAQTKAAELTKDGSTKVELLDYSQGNCSKPEPQMKKFNEAIAKKVEAIIISCISADACKDPIDAAVSKGIPVVTFDNDSPDSKRFTYYGIDNFEAGKLAAQLLAEAFPDGGNVALFKAYDNAAYHPRNQGFEEGIKETKLILATDVTCKSDCFTETSYIIEAAMKKFPDLNGWFFVGVTPIINGDYKMPRWKEATRKGMKTIAIDAMSEELDWVRSGKIYALIPQPYWGWGYDTVQIIYDFMVNGKNFEKNSYVKADVVSKKNVSAYQKMWSSGNFSQPLPPYK